MCELDELIFGQVIEMMMIDIYVIGDDFSELFIFDFLLYNLLEIDRNSILEYYLLSYDEVV